MPPPSLTVIGAAGLDEVVRIPRLPKPNDRQSALESGRFPGGMGGNVATAFARLGGNATFAGVFPDGEDGDFLRNDLVREGIDCSPAVTIEGRTGQTLILVDARGKRSIVYRGVPGTRTMPTLNLAALIAVPAIYVVGNAALPLLTHIPNMAKLAIDIELGHLDSTPVDSIQRLLGRADIVFGNEGSLTGLAARLNCKVATLPVRGILAITRGRNGATIIAPDQTIQVPALRIRPVDTTGAGDCFAAAFTLGWLEGWPLPRASLCATTAASLSTLALGARSGYPARAVVEHRMIRRRPPR